MQRRSGTTRYPWCWVTPGGKRKAQEHDFTTLRRELREEHNVHLGEYGRWCRELVYEHEVVPTKTGEPVLVRCFRVAADLVQGTYAAACPAVAGFDWVSANELETLMLGPADSANLGKLLELIR